MRAIFIFTIYTILCLTGCATVEVAKEVTKASKSVKTSVSKIFESTEENGGQEKSINNNTNINEREIELKIKKSKEEISKEKEKASKVVTKQKKIANINLLNMQISELNKIIGNPSLIREDGNVKTLRFDSKSCRFFIFMNSKVSTPKVKYYEIRDTKGELIDVQKKIENCFNEIKPV